MHRVLLPLIIFSLVACKGSKSVSTEETVQKEIVKHLGSEYERIDQGNLALCFTKPEYVGSEWKTIIVLDIQTLDLLYGPEKQNTKVSWADTRVLKFADQSEVIQDKQSDSSPIHYYNLDTKEDSANLN